MRAPSFSLRFDVTIHSHSVKFPPQTTNYGDFGMVNSFADELQNKIARAHVYNQGCSFNRFDSSDARIVLSSVAVEMFHADLLSFFNAIFALSQQFASHRGAG
jgi:hypothetical protein